jgi:hypothetical protein
MERRLYRELWADRFNKMLALEEQSIVAYEALLADCRKKYKGHAIEPHLARLIADETRHALLVRELIAILERQESR